MHHSILLKEMCVALNINDTLTWRLFVWQGRSENSSAAPKLFMPVGVQRQLQSINEDTSIRLRDFFSLDNITTPLVHDIKSEALLMQNNLRRLTLFCVVRNGRVARVALNCFIGMQQAVRHTWVEFRGRLLFILGIAKLRAENVVHMLEEGLDAGQA